MSAKTKKPLVPRLRFAEFRDAGEWEEKTLEDIADSENSSLALNKINLKKKGYSVYGADGVVGYIDEYQQDERYISIVKDGAGIGRLNLCQPKSSILGTLTCIRSKNLRNFNLDWIYYQMNIIDFSLYKKGSGIPHIYFSDFKAKSISVPQLREQQKIAACLTALDDLISAATGWLDALKQHKQGLMQQLFPAEGETVPRLRFPEFRDAGEWEEKRLEQVAIFLKGKGIAKSDMVPNGSVPCIRYGELYTDYQESITKVKSFVNLDPGNLVLSRINDVIIPASGETEEEIATASCVLQNDIALGGDINIIRSRIHGVFFSYYLNCAKRKNIARLAQGIAVVHLYPSQLKKLIISVPKKSEQQKIAACLTALDDLIAAQTQKIAKLKTHKRGLMQQLFPTVDETNR